MELSLTVAGDVASFGLTARETLRTSIMQELGCHEPSCYLEVRVSASSVRVVALLTVPDAPAGPGSNSDPTPSSALSNAAAIQAAAAAFVAQPAAALSTALGVTVVATAMPLAVSRAVVPFVVAPPPPQTPPQTPPRAPPQAPPHPPPQAPPASLLPAASSPSALSPPFPPPPPTLPQLSSTAAAISAAEGDGTLPLVGIIGCVLGAIVAFGVAIAVYLRRRSQRTTATSKVSLSPSVRQHRASTIDSTASELDVSSAAMESARLESVRLSRISLGMQSLPRVLEASRSPVGSVSEESERSGQPELEVVSMRTSEAQQRSSREDEPAPSPTPSLSASIIDHFADFELRNSMVEWPDSPPISPANASGADGPSSSPSRKSRVRVSSQERRRSMDYI